MLDRPLPLELRAASRAWQLLCAAWEQVLALRPRTVLVALTVVQWLALAALVRSIHHNGWLFYQGGDQTFYYSTSWALAHGHIPPSSIGYFWSFLSAPVAFFAGPSFLVGLPALILFQVLVLGPLGLVAAYGLGSRVGGRAIGYLAAAAWVVAPYLTIPGFVHRFHAVYVEQVLPQATGLTGLADFPSMILIAVAAWLFLRALDGRDDRQALLAGLLTGAVIGLKPANAPFLLGPALAVLAARRWRLGAVYAASMLPALLTLVLWKDRTIGHLPLVGSTGAAYAAAGAGAATGGLAAAGGLHTYLHFDWSQLGQNMDQIREFFWSKRLVEWLPFAGLFAVARSSLPKAALLGGWLGGFVIVKAASPAASVQDGTFFRLMMPAWPAYLLLAASLPLLVPGVAARVRPAIALSAPRGVPLRSRGVAVAVLLLAVVPLVLVAALPRLDGRRIVADFNYNTLVPTTVDLGVQATARGHSVTLTWRPPARGGTRPYYRVYAAPTTWDAGIGLPPSVDEITCDPNAQSNAKCRLTPQRNLGPTRLRRLVDRGLAPGSWTYRVAVLANWLDDPSKGDTFMVSKPARVVVR